MNLGIAQKLNGELLRDKNKPARSCHQESPICTDAYTSVPHAVRGLLSDQFQAHSKNTRVIRAFRAAEPVLKNSNLCVLRGLCGEL